MKVKRNIPEMFIALSNTPLSENEPQNLMRDFLECDLDGPKKNSKRKGQNRPRGSKKAAEDLQLERAPKKDHRNTNNNKNGDSSRKTPEKVG